jgi:outer membrane protein OmpA-like peptidoglycan-associated protein/opacity protein-like surface antigen
MKKIFYIISLLVFISTHALAYNVKQDSTIFGYEKEEYGPKPKSFTVRLLTGGYFNGVRQNFPANFSKANNIWRYGVGFGYAFDQNLEMGAHLAYTPTLNNGFDLFTYDYGVNALYNFILSEHAVPYVTAGVGAIQFKQPGIVDFTRFQFNVAGGVKFFAFKNLALAPEVGTIVSFSPGNAALTVSLNAIYYFGFTPKVLPDRDGDGIPDKHDKCPDQAETVDGKNDTDGCPEILDRDKDGIPDKQDVCPDHPETRNGFLDEDGCPENPKDLDGDGILNESDKCPKEPETKNGFQDDDGCPEGADDIDGDGIINDKDKCPKDPETKNGFADDDGCPEDANDIDGDGIPNDKDKCPKEPETVNNYEDGDGCPDIVPNDSDGDGVPDNKDQCQGEKEVYNGYKDQDGCADHELDEFSGVIEGIYFEINQAMIKRESYPKLNRAAEVLGKYKILNFVIEGHTDNTGSKAYNMNLSEKRAQSVYEYLRYRGIMPERMKTQAFGPTKPIADNKTEKGRSKNRRIEFKILNLEEAKKEAEEMKNRAR